MIQPMQHNISPHILLIAKMDIRHKSAPRLIAAAAASPDHTTFVFILALLISLAGVSYSNAQMPTTFVYLKDVDPTIIQDLRYAGSHNFVGRPIAGYMASECIVTRAAAQALAKVQQELQPRSLSLIVWDCYRPTRAVADFAAWSKNKSDTRMKTEFYPRTDKAKMFSLGYLASRSAHSRGSTIDLGIVLLPYAPSRYDPDAPLVPCTARKGERFEDGTIDLGTGYDCLDVLAATASPSVGQTALANRAMLSDLMVAHGFRGYRREWWHFELVEEPFPEQSFDFPVVPRK